MSSRKEKRCSICRRTTGYPKWTYFTEIDYWLDAWEEQDKNQSEKMLKGPAFRLRGTEVQIMICSNCLSNFFFDSVLARAKGVFDNPRFAKAFEAFLSYWVEHGDTVEFHPNDDDVEPGDLTAFVEVILGKKVKLDPTWSLRLIGKKR